MSAAARSGDVARAARHWDERHAGAASAERRASTYALASDAYDREYVRRRLSHDGVDWVEVARRRACADGPLGSALVLGCGLGDALVDFHRRGFARRLHGVDVSAEAIERARVTAAEAGLGDAITFEVGDFHELDLGRERYDAVVFVMSLHHALDVRAVLARAAAALQPGGVLVANEYVGPDRWQFTWTQLFAIKALLTVMPRRLRTRADGSTKGRIGRPTVAWMLAHDPSEAAQSSAIPAAIAERFEHVERRDYGGAVAIPVLDEIAHHFHERDPEAMRWLARTIALDAWLERRGLAPASNALFIARAPRT